TTRPAAAAIPVRAQPAPLALQAAAAKARPAAVARDGFSAAEVATVQRVDDWFNSFDHLVGTFTQIAPDGARSRGRFFLEKPGKLRFQYALPSTLDIVSNGKTIAVVDHKLDTSDVYPLSQTPLRFLLKRNLDLLDDAKVTAVKNSPERASVTVEEHSNLTGTSRLTVVFAGNPFALKQWTVTDPQGLDTTVMVDHLDSQQIPPEQAFTIN
ncbi:MAG TPA: outer membrane lipoprotein carrier protein LolA, partial [Solirubrobacterales bacterium]|nr:outer membrane lipoprotein carrier protein LolA [Solirubrobacterales bacterium]